MSKICHNCKTTMPDDSEKCLICGGKLDIASSEEINTLLNAHIKKMADERVNKVLENMQNGVYQKEKNTPKCPTCNSTNITKISTTSKVVGAVAFGLFSKTARSQFKCNNCGYKW